MSVPDRDRCLLDIHDALLLDLDGVVYVGSQPVAHAVAGIQAARERGVLTAFVTNNAARPPDVVAEHLRSFGLDVADADVVTSAQAGAREVALRVPPGSPVLAVGGPGVAAALEARGLRPVTDARDAPTAVLMGYGPDVSWRELAEASYAVGEGALFVVTNTDATIPTSRGIAPGNGTLVAAVQTATGVAPVVCGKPFAPLMDESVERIGARRPLVVGDRLDTDIQAGHAAGMASLLVLTGVTGVDSLLVAPPEQRPTYLAADLRGLSAPAGGLVLAGGGGSDPLGELRRACRRAWVALDAGDQAPAVDAGSLSRDVLVALTG
jgi:HAD superfamily hydrolase (TIGR01450 family)